MTFVNIFAHLVTLRPKGRGIKPGEIEDEILLAIASVHRSSSLIENFNSRLRSYLDPRKGFKKSRYALIQFALNHLPFERSIHEKLVGHSPAEVFTQTDHIDFLSLLDLQRFKKAA